MVGFVDFDLFKQVYYPANSDNLTGWVSSFERGLGENQSLEIPEIIEKSEQGRVKNPFSETIDKYDEIQLKLQEIREIWSEGYNYHAKEIRRIEPLISGLVKIKFFINDYWQYFTPNEKIRLVTQANLLKWYHESIKNLTFRKWLKFVFPKRIFILLKLYFKYYKNIRENPKSHVFIQLQNANLMLAELILDRAREDFNEVSFLNQTNSEDDFFEMFKQNKLVLSKEDTDLFISLITNPPKANNELKQAIKKYRSEYGI